MEEIRSSIVQADGERKLVLKDMTYSAYRMVEYDDGHIELHPAGVPLPVPDLSTRYTESQSTAGNYCAKKDA